MFKGTRFQVFFLVAAAQLGCVVLISNGLAQPPKPDTPAPGETQVFTTKATKVQAARSMLIASAIACVLRSNVGPAARRGRPPAPH